MSQARLPPVPGTCPAQVTSWGGRLGSGVHSGAEGTSASSRPHLCVVVLLLVSTWLSRSGRRGSSGLQWRTDRFPLRPRLWDTHPPFVHPFGPLSLIYLSITDLVGTLRVGPGAREQPKCTCTPMMPPCLEAQPPLTWSLRCEDQVLLACL